MLANKGEGACSPYTTWQHAYKHRPWERMRLETNKIKQVSFASILKKKKKCHSND